MNLMFDSETRTPIYETYLKSSSSMFEDDGDDHDEKDEVVGVTKTIDSRVSRSGLAPVTPLTLDMRPGTPIHNTDDRASPPSPTSCSNTKIESSGVDSTMQSSSGTCVGDEPASSRRYELVDKHHPHYLDTHGGQHGDSNEHRHERAQVRRERTKDSRDEHIFNSNEQVEEIEDRGDDQEGYYFETEIDKFSEFLLDLESRFPECAARQPAEQTPFDAEAVARKLLDRVRDDDLSGFACFVWCVRIVEYG